MVNKDKQMQKMRSILKDLFKFAKEEFDTLKLEDGTQITISTSDLEIGSQVFVLDDSGNQSTLDDGTYTLQDGRTFTIADNGVTEITEVGGEDEETDSSEPGTDVTTTADTKMDGLPAGHGEEQDEKDIPAAEGEQTDSSKRLDDLEHQVAEILNILNKIGDGQNAVNEQMMSRINAIADEPGDKPVKNGKKGYDVYSKSAIKEKQSQEALDSLRKLTAQIKSTSNSNHR